MTKRTIIRMDYAHCNLPKPALKMQKIPVSESLYRIQNYPGRHTSGTITTPCKNLHNIYRSPCMKETLQSGLVLTDILTASASSVRIITVYSMTDDWWTFVSSNLRKCFWAPDRDWTCKKTYYIDTLYSIHLLYISKHCTLDDHFASSQV